MAKEIPLDKIADHLRKSIQETVEAVTLEAHGRLVTKTPVGETGRLQLGWQPDLANGVITNNVEYGEPVIYGTALPPSWGGKFRTRQGTIPGFPDLIAKELEPWAKDVFQSFLKKGI